MLALSILQPWAWLILRPDVTDPAERRALALKGQIKNIENRTWPTKVRGTIAVHAGKSFDRWNTDDVEYLWTERGIALPCPIEHLPRGGIVGFVDIVDCVSASESWWFRGPYGLVLSNPRPVPYLPWKGRQRFFEVPDELAVIA